MIKITQVRLDNFLSYGGTVLINDIAPISVFVGPNNSGKSNLIRCLKFYHQLAKYSKLAEYSDTDKIMKMKHRLTTSDPLSIEIKYWYENQNRSSHPLELTHLISYNTIGEFDRESLSFKRSEPDDNIDIFKVEKNDTNYFAFLQNVESVNAFFVQL